MWQFAMHTDRNRDPKTRRLDRFTHALRGKARDTHVSPRQYRHKFFPTIAGKQVLRAMQTAVEKLGGRFQHFVPREVAVGIVVALEKSTSIINTASGLCWSRQIAHTEGR